MTPTAFQTPAPPARAIVWDVELRRLRLLLQRRIAWLRLDWHRDAGDDFQGAAIGDAQVDRILSTETPRDAELRFQRDDPAARSIGLEIEELERETPPQPLATLLAAFDLTTFERDLIVLLFAAELDGDFELLFGYVHDDIARKYVSLHLAAPLFGTTPAEAAGAAQRLRDLALLHLDPPPQPAMPLASRPLRLDPRVVDHLRGLDRIPDEVAELLRPLEGGPLSAEHAALADSLAGENAVNLTGAPQSGKETLALAIAARSNRTLHKLDPRRLPPIGAERTSALRALDREARLLRLAYFVQTPEREAPDLNSEVAMQDLVDGLRAPLIVDTRDAWNGSRRMTIARVTRPGRNAQRQLWEDALQGEPQSPLPATASSWRGEGQGEGPSLAPGTAPHPSLRSPLSPLTQGEGTEPQSPLPATASPWWGEGQGEGSSLAPGTAPHPSLRSPLSPLARGEGTEPPAHLLDDLVEQFDFSPEMIARAARAARHHPELSARALWDICQQQVSWRVDDLAQLISTRQTWDDLVLDADETAQLREIASQVAQRAQVYERWGFASRLMRGRGITALFAGPSGTGKTMAAEIIAGELGLELYRIDLAGVVSKYIGESEKNLRRVFDAAEQSGAILFFDEADALFGKRTEVKDSHDLYANIQVNYLLQRMEDYRGLAILATNRKSALDRAFLRRLRFVIDFPFPDRDARERIWRHAFPSEAPITSLDLEFLSRLEIAGGNIRNIALNSAFLAARDGQEINERHVMHAVRREYAKIQKLVTEGEFGTHYRGAS